MATLSNKLQDRLAKIRKEDALFVKHSLAIAYFVQSELERQGRTQKDLAAAIGKKESEVSKWLSGIHNLTLHSLSLLEVGLGVSILHIGQTAAETIPKITKNRILNNEGQVVIPSRDRKKLPSSTVSGALVVSEPEPGALITKGKRKRHSD